MERKPHAKPGNKDAIKIKDKDSRQQAFQAYLLHLEAGYPKESFHFDNEKGASCCWETIERYIKENPSEFPPNLMKRAMSKRYKLWFDVGVKMSKGSPEVWKTIMRNMFGKDFGWDKEESKHSSFTPEQEETIKALFRGIQEMRDDSKKKKS